MPRLSKKHGVARIPDRFPDYRQGGRWRWRGIPHPTWIRATVRDLMNQGHSALQISHVHVLGLIERAAAYLMKRVGETGRAEPLPHGVHSTGCKITREHLAFVRAKFIESGCRKTSDQIASLLQWHYGIEISGGGVRAAFKRHGIRYKRITRMDKRAFTERVKLLTRMFLLRRVMLNADEGVWADEMIYSSEEVGSNYGWMTKGERACQIDDGRSSGPRVMFLAAMTKEGVMQGCTLPVPQPLTVTGHVFEQWCEFYVIPAMIAQGKTYIVLDNARVHRKNVLRVMFAAAGLRVYFLPPYSPWFQPIEKIFLSTHMKCNRQVEHVRANFVRRVIDVLEAHTPAECAGCLRATGWN